MLGARGTSAVHAGRPAVPSIWAKLSIISLLLGTFPGRRWKSNSLPQLSTTGKSWGAPCPPFMLGPFLRDVRGQQLRAAVEGGSCWCFQLLKSFMVADALRFATPLSSAILASLCALPVAAPSPLQSQPSLGDKHMPHRVPQQRFQGPEPCVIPFDNLPEQFPYPACPAVGEFRLWQKLCLPSERLKTPTRSADSSLSTKKEKHRHQRGFFFPPCPSLLPATGPTGLML